MEIYVAAVFLVLVGVGVGAAYFNSAGRSAGPTVVPPLENLSVQWFQEIPKRARRSTWARIDAQLREQLRRSDCDRPAMERLVSKVVGAAWNAGVQSMDANRSDPENFAVLTNHLRDLYLACLDYRWGGVKPYYSSSYAHRRTFGKGTEARTWLFNRTGEECVRNYVTDAPSDVSEEDVVGCVQSFGAQVSALHSADIAEGEPPEMIIGVCPCRLELLNEDDGELSTIGVALVLTTMRVAGIMVTAKDRLDAPLKYENLVFSMMLADVECDSAGVGTFVEDLLATGDGRGAPSMSMRIRTGENCHVFRPCLESKWYSPLWLEPPSVQFIRFASTCKAVMSVTKSGPLAYMRSEMIQGGSVAPAELVRKGVLSAADEQSLYGEPLTWPPEAGRPTGLWQTLVRSDDGTFSVVGAAKDGTKTLSITSRIG